MSSSDSKAQSFVRRRALILGVAVILGTLALDVQAEPIPDGALAPHRVGWFDNGGTMTCAETCKAKAPGSSAEHEPSPIAPTKRVFVCKVAGKPNGDLRTWLYGNQFDDRPACYTTGLDLKGSYSKKFSCLCVR
ncbi:MAG TPA: hypothetical protein VEL74_10845 [Thermoanaerobaculia bacterium]|nr:hypothetical protein [Thermoanaerobaculia bacterium]